jgi:hypothetical protein
MKVSVPRDTDRATCKFKHGIVSIDVHRNAIVGGGAMTLAMLAVPVFGLQVAEARVEGAQVQAILSMDEVGNDVIA